MTAKAETATLFHRLHEGPEPLLLPNAWDAGSARLMESLGAKAVATTSAGVAWTHGYPDGDVLPVRMLISTVVAIARAIRVPLTVDVEGGYSDDPAAVEETVARIVEAGAVGINIEDGPGAPDLLCLKIERAKRAGQHFGIDLFVNARTDVYLRGLAPEGKQVAETLARAKLYRNAGASGIFVPGLRDADRDQGGRRRSRSAAERHGVAGLVGRRRAGATRRAPPQRRRRHRAGAVGQGGGARRRFPEDGKVRTARRRRDGLSGDQRAVR